MKSSFPVLALAILTACGNADEATATTASADATAPATSTTPSSKPSSKAAPSATTAKGASSSKPKFTSDYTSLGEVKCETVEFEEVGGFVRERCGSFKDVPLFRVEADLRQSAYAGNEPTGQTTLGAFNFLTDKVEWRMQNGKPIALIYRLKVDGIDMPDYGKTQLFVQKIGLGDEQSCIIGMVAGSYPKANEKAREIADSAAAITCSDEYQPKSFGDLL